MTLIKLGRKKPTIMFPSQEKDMIQNVGNIDRGLRIAIGTGLIAASLLGYIGLWGWIGAIPLATGLLRVCPAYLPFGLSTCPAKTVNVKC